MKANHCSVRRSGTVLVTTAFLMVVMMAMVALAVDVGYMAVVDAELQRSADAAAMSAAWDLIRANRVGVADPSEALAAARSSAARYCALNHVAHESPGLAVTDVQIGTIANPSDPTSPMSADAPERYNAVWVRVRRTGGQNQEVPLFFARVLGFNSVPLQAQATAVFVNNVGGLRAPSDGSNLGILPYALKETTWDDLLAGKAEDKYAWDPVTETVTAGADGVKEVNLFPQETGAPGNCGTVDIGGSDNSTSDIKRQIVSGISNEDFQELEDAGYSLEFNDDGQLTLEGDTGVSAGVSEMLNQIKGQTRIIPLYAAVSGNGNNAKYNIVHFVGVRIMHVDLSGGKNKNKKVVIQPADILAKGAVPAAGDTRSYQVFSPVWLIRWQPPADWLQDF